MEGEGVEDAVVELVEGGVAVEVEVEAEVEAEAGEVRVTEQGREGI